MAYSTERPKGAAGCQAADAAEPPTLHELFKLADTDIEVSIVDNLSDDLHRLFDPVTDATLPIYFGPLLGRLYLEGL